MKVYINGSALLAPLTGIGQYVRQLVTALRKIEKENIYVYCGLKCDNSLQPNGTGYSSSSQRTIKLLKKYIPNFRGLRKIGAQISFNHHIKKEHGNALYHEPNFLPQNYDGPTVITVHDLSCFDYPETHPEDRVRQFNKELPGAIERADHILVVSEWTKSAVSRWFGVSDHRITNTYLAADARFCQRSPEELGPELKKLKLVSGQYILCVGTLEPRKNLSILFSAYSKLPDHLRSRFPLVVAGMHGWHTELLMKSAQQLLKKNELRLLGYVPDPLIPALYSGAAAFCYPSKYEGFGLPALEAMASGVPVITCNQTSLPEVVGEAGLMSHPDDVDGMHQNLLRVLDDRSFALKLGQLGLNRAQLFSWDRCAQETYQAYKHVISARGGLH